MSSMVLTDIKAEVERVWPNVDASAIQWQSADYAL